MQKNEAWNPILYYTQELTQNGSKTSRPETVKVLEESISCKLLNIGLGDDFLDLTPKAKITKAKIDK